MAVTNKQNSKSSRLDFGIALNDALFIGESHNDTYNTTVFGDDDVHLSHDNGIQDENVGSVESKSVSHANTEQELSATPIKKAKEMMDEEDLFLQLIKNGRGYQRSVYFESDVFQYIQAKSIKYDVKFSNIVNMLLKEVIYKK